MAVERKIGSIITDDEIKAARLHYEVLTTYLPILGEKKLLDLMEAFRRYQYEAPNSVDPIALLLEKAREAGAADKLMRGTIAHIYEAFVANQEFWQEKLEERKQEL